MLLAPLAAAVELLVPHVPGETAAVWRARLGTPLARVIAGEHLHLDHRRACAMRGEWLRAALGLVPKEGARDFVERHWVQSQRERIAADPLNLYRDPAGASPAFETAGRANLLALVEEGYDGNSAVEIRRAAERGTAVSLLMQGPCGEPPPGGGDSALDQFAYELMAERSLARGDALSAGRYRRAAMLSFSSLARRERAGRVLAAALLERRTACAEAPAPCETGGYAFAAGPAAFANAGGMGMAANLHGSSAMPLGVVRFSRPGWEPRLGPSDGVCDPATGRGVSFGPTWMDGGRWIRIAGAAERYHGRFHAEFVHPLLVRCSIEYVPLAGQRGAGFRHDFVLTPDGILATLHASPAVQYGITWPLVEDEGLPLQTAAGGYIASVRHPASAGEQNFIAIASVPGVADDEETVSGPGGSLRPVRSRSNRTFIYPRVEGDPPAEAVRASFRQTAQGFSSLLGRVNGNLYVGRTSAGGEGRSIDLDGDGRPDAAFTPACGFLLQLDGGRVTAVEVDREVRATIAGKRFDLAPFTPQFL